MIPTLIYLAYRKFIRPHWPQIYRMAVAIFKRSNILIASLIVLLMLIALMLPAQSQTQKYAIVHKGNEVGWIQVEKNISGATTSYLLNSMIRTRLILQFTASIHEETQFKDGNMIYSYLYRKMNGSVKTDKQTRFTGNSYVVQKGSDQQELALPGISYNLHCLYFQEPVNITQVYSDNFQRFIKVERLGAGIYKIELPDGVTNYFHYQKGICTKIRVDHGIYSVEIILKS